MLVQAQVAQQHRAGQEQGSGVGLVLALDIQTDVSAAGLEDGNIAAHVAAGNQTGATDQGGTNVGQDATVQVGHDHDVKLLGLRDTLHAGVVDDHVVVLDAGELGGDLLAGVAEETVGQLHDVGLVDAGDPLATVGQGEGEGKLGDPLGLGARDDLERLDDAGDALVLETAVLSLGVLTDDAQVDVLVPRLVAGDVLDQDDGGVDVELLTHGHVEAGVAGPLDGGVQDTLEAELVALQGRDGLAEELLGALQRRGVHTGHVDLLPVDGNIVGLEDGLDALGDLGTDTVTGDQGDGVLATELGRAEDVLVDGRVGSSSDPGLLACSGSRKALGSSGRRTRQHLDDGDGEEGGDSRMPCRGEDMEGRVSAGGMEIEFGSHRPRMQIAK